MTSAMFGATKEGRESRTSSIVAWTLITIAIGSVALLVVAIPINLNAQTDGSLVELASAAAAAAIFRWALRSAGLLRWALVAQAADMLTFVLAWQRGAAEQNPLARGLVDWALGALPATGSFPFAVAGMVLIVAKLALVTYIVRVAANLGHY